MVKRYLDINGVRVVFELLKEKLSLTKEELYNELKKNISDNFYQKTEIDEKILNIYEDLGEYEKKFDNYYTKQEVDGMLPEELSIENVNSAYNEKNN